MNASNEVRSSKDDQGCPNTSTCRTPHFSHRVPFLSIRIPSMKVNFRAIAAATFAYPYFTLTSIGSVLRNLDCLISLGSLAVGSDMLLVPYCKV